MKSLRKIAVSLACLAVVCGASLAWHIYKEKADERALAEEATIWRVRAGQGDVEAAANLGHMYSNGKGVLQDYAEALRWYREAADQGYAKGQDGLAFMYSHGQGVAQDYGEALRWYRKAAEQGDAKGQYDLGVMYYYGRGVPQDYAQALRWYRKAVDQGYAKAQYSLGIMYYYGRGVPQDRPEAIRWYRKAADLGDDDALRAISARLTLFTKLALFGEFLLGIWLLSDFLSGKRPRDLPQRLLAGAGALCTLSAGLTWYGYAHHQIRCLHCGFAVFTLFRWFLDAVLIALLVYVVGKGSNVAADGL
ncbi:MAG: tetratricopeptide repeat protein [Candidatus Sulfotelmatobacter sp.]